MTLGKFLFCLEINFSYRKSQIECSVHPASSFHQRDTFSPYWEINTGMMLLTQLATSCISLMFPLMFFWCSRIQPSVPFCIYCPVPPVSSESWQLLSLHLFIYLFLLFLLWPWYFWGQFFYRTFSTWDCLIVSPNYIKVLHFWPEYTESVCPSQSNISECTQHQNILFLVMLTTISWRKCSPLDLDTENYHFPLCN